MKTPWSSIVAIIIIAIVIVGWSLFGFSSKSPVHAELDRPTIGPAINIEKKDGSSRMVAVCMAVGGSRLALGWPLVSVERLMPTCSTGATNVYPVAMALQVLAVGVPVFFLVRFILKKGNQNE